MVEESFKNLFQEFVKKIPHVEGGHLTSVNFTVIYPEEGGAPAKNALVARYMIGEKYMESLIQSPKDAILGDIDISKLKPVKIANQKFYTNYNPGIGYFPSEYLPSETTKLFTLMTDRVITIATDEKKYLKLIKWNKFVKPSFRVVELIKKIPEKLNGFEMRFVYGGRETHRDHFTLIFINGTEKEIRMEYYEDEKSVIELIVDALKKKRTDKSIMKGEMEGKPAAVLRMSKNSVLVLKLIKGEEDDLSGVLTKLAEVLR